MERSDTESSASDERRGVGEAKGKRRAATRPLETSVNLPSLFWGFGLSENFSPLCHVSCYSWMLLSHIWLCETS